ncbi:MAG TPA: MBL fold metallo-hydrolase [Clostridia bacterium]|nr:MBL fold metallo-hydrolase [Clostridia bacterium]
MKIQLIRHATLRIEIDDKVFLVDPMLSDAGIMPPIQNSGDGRRNPLVPLPVGIDDVLRGVNAVLVTHTHRDHWDQAATEVIPRNTRIICQPEDARKFHDLGFEDVRPIYSAAIYGHVAIYRTEGRHGTREIGKAMAPVSGFVLRSRAGECVYIAGDTIWCLQVRDALMRYRPPYTIVNCGGARFTEGDPITMTSGDVARVATEAEFTRVIAVHMDSINHCRVTRAQLAADLAGRDLCNRVVIPADGEILTIGS